MIYVLRGIATLDVFEYILYIYPCLYFLILRHNHIDNHSTWLKIQFTDEEGSQERGGRKKAVDLPPTEQTPCQQEAGVCYQASQVRFEPAMRLAGNAAGSVNSPPRS